MLFTSMCSCPIDDACRHNTGMMTKSLMASHAYGKGQSLMWTGEQDSSSFEGATVLEPQSGIPLLTLS
eukprot:790403-Prorocentrum_minimum.AAC.1